MAIAGTNIWEVRTDGHDDNGGGFDPAHVAAGGVDLSQQAAPHFNGTISNTSANRFTPSGHTVVNADRGNILTITAGGVGRYTITSINSPSNEWILNRNHDGGTSGRLGGALASPGKLGVIINTANEGANNQKGYIKSGTYTLATATLGSGGPYKNTTRSGIILEGYQTNRGDLLGRPILDAGVITAVTLFETTNVGNNFYINLGVDGNNNATVNGFSLNSIGSEAQFCEAIDCGASNVFAFNIAKLLACKARGCYNSFHLYHQAAYCYALNGTRGFNTNQASPVCVGCISKGQSTHGWRQYGGSNSLLINCTAIANVGFSGFFFDDSTATLMNCLSTHHNGGGDFGYSATAGFPINLINCAGYDNATHYDAALARIIKGFTILTADPYQDYAGNDFRPNLTLGGGASLRDAGIGLSESPFFGSDLQIDNRVIGALQPFDLLGIGGQGMSGGLLV